MTTNYTLDLAAGLTQVLADGTSTYLYGNGRIAQAGSTAEYFLGDALGSVRQLADPAGAVTLTQSYAPYGDVTQSVGTSQTSYAFTGESRDANGLTYLRARYYAPNDGRFINRDTWAGDYNRPLSLNRWGYVKGNPVNFIDPSGHYGHETHYDVTWDLVNKNPKAVMFRDPQNPLRTLAHIIAEGNQKVDKGGITNALSCTACHFSSLASSIKHVETAIESKNAFLFGATMHQLQDYYSHWGEGFSSSNFFDFGHLAESVRRIRRSSEDISDFYLGGHYWDINSTPPIWYASPYPAHDYEETISDILKRNPQLTRNDLINDDVIIDLYLRRDPSAVVGTMQTQTQRIIERDHFGFDTDLYVANSSREIAMKQISWYYINKFIDALPNSCEIGWETLNGWEASSSSWEIRELLTSN